MTDDLREKYRINCQHKIRREAAELNHVVVRIEKWINKQPMEVQKDLIEYLMNYTHHVSTRLHHRYDDDHQPLHRDLDWLPPEPWYASLWDRLVIRLRRNTKK